MCTPSHWAPEAKIGLHWGQAHAPVADNEALMAAQRHIIGLCTNGQCWQRSVYTLSPDDRYVFVTCEGIGSEPGAVDVIDLATRTRVASIDVGQMAGGIDMWRMSSSTTRPPQP